ncbi:hypothetical protein GF322_04325 [Candidatus Dependentiae bacterium]|nr:hypothetical protein [Candidatus Dependentiae bacterium]
MFKNNFKFIFIFLFIFYTTGFCVSSDLDSLIESGETIDFCEEEKNSIDVSNFEETKDVFEEQDYDEEEELDYSNLDLNDLSESEDIKLTTKNKIYFALQYLKYHVKENVKWYLTYLLIGSTTAMCIIYKLKRKK